MATGKALDGKPYAGNPHVRFDEGEVASCTAEASLRREPCRRQPEGCASRCAATPRRGSLLYKLESRNKFQVPCYKSLAALVSRFSFLVLSLLLPGAAIAAPAESGHPINPDRSPNARRLIKYLYFVKDRKILTGTTACSDYNNAEAYWVKYHTGKFPAINQIDFIHDGVSTPGGWIDYSNPAVMLEWASKGIVAAMWHIGCKTNDGKGGTCTPGDAPDRTSFKPSCIEHPESEECKELCRRIDRVSAWLKITARRDMPVLWRPLHEAQGNWNEEFTDEEHPGGRDWHTAWMWWGIEGPEKFVNLWRFMYDRMVNKNGLTNLVWVFTAGDSKRWYPGDGYVDVIGTDMYGCGAKELKDCFDFLSREYPGKPIALAECGGLKSPFDEWWNAGAHFAYYCAWYDGTATWHPEKSEKYKTGEHGSMDAAYWRAVFSNDCAVSARDLPAFRQKPAIPAATKGKKTAPAPEGYSCGWDSWRTYGNSFYEENIKMQADAMAKHLLASGYNTIVLGPGWYEDVTTWRNRELGGSDVKRNEDEHGVPIPGTVKFPSSAGGMGFRPLADYVHSKGLYLAVTVPEDIAEFALAEKLYKSWGVDYVRTFDGASALKSWEIESGWNFIRDVFNRRRSQDIDGKGAYPDLGPLPLGKVFLGKAKPFSADEQKSIMAFWAIAKSPLVVGGDLVKMDASTRKILAAKEILEMNRASANPREAHHDPDTGVVVWTADAPGGGKYVCVFNAGDEEQKPEFNLRDFGALAGAASITELWSGRTAKAKQTLLPKLRPHACAAFLIIH